MPFFVSGFRTPLKSLKRGFQVFTNDLLMVYQGFIKGVTKENKYLSRVYPELTSVSVSVLLLAHLKMLNCHDNLYDVQTISQMLKHVAFTLVVKKHSLLYYIGASKCSLSLQP